MLFVVNYDIKTQERETEFLKSLNDLGECVVYMPGCLFLDSEQERKDIYNKMREGLWDEDLLLVSVVNPDDLSGWLTNSVVKWFQNYKDKKR